MTPPLLTIALFDGGLAALEGLHEFYFVMAPTVMLGLVSLVLDLFALFRRRASRRFVRTTMVVAAIAGAASAACAMRYLGSRGDESVVAWFGAQTIVVLVAASAAWFVARRRGNTVP